MTLKKHKRMMTGLPILMRRIRRCRDCEPQLPFGARPIVQADAAARILIVGQAPGRRAHESGVPWSDPSGIRLREWMALGEERFYDPASVAIMPMGFCSPGTGPAGDLPPRKECARQWHHALRVCLPNIQLTLLV